MWKYELKVKNINWAIVFKYILRMTLDILYLFDKNDFVTQLWFFIFYLFLSNNVPELK